MERGSRLVMPKKCGWWKFHDEVQKITKVERDSGLSSAIKTIIQKVRGSPNTEVIFDLETLQNMPTEVIQSLRISANYDNYQWTISEGGQSFYKT